MREFGGHPAGPMTSSFASEHVATPRPLGAGPRPRGYRTSSPVSGGGTCPAGPRMSKPKPTVVVCPSRSGVSVAVSLTDGEACAEAGRHAQYTTSPRTTISRARRTAPPGPLPSELSVAQTTDRLHPEPVVPPIDRPVHFARSRRVGVTTRAVIEAHRAAEAFPSAPTGVRRARGVARKRAAPEVEGEGGSRGA